MIGLHVIFFFFLKNKNVCTTTLDAAHANGDYSVLLILKVIIVLMS